ncbi:MAG: SAM-dependent methyltransferase [Nanoarchaeota archaeon]
MKSICDAEMIFVIEHLEPKLSKWCLLEYRHMSEEVGKENLWFTNIKKPSAELKKLGKVFSKPAHELLMERPCVLDPEGEKELSPADSKRFSHLIFGGILGDYPPKKRTREVFPGVAVERRNLGPVQMSTDTAVVVSKIICDGTPLGKITFQDTINLEMGEGESVELPYRYILKDGKPALPDGLVEYLKKKRTF